MPSPRPSGSPRQKTPTSGWRAWRRRGNSSRRGGEVTACQTQVEEYLVRRPKPTAEERQQIDVIVRTRAAVNVLTLDNGLGLMDPQKRTPPTPPKTRKVKLITPAAIACLKELDALIDKHRETPIVTDTYNNQTQLLGAVTYGFPPRFDGKPEQARPASTREVWEEWYQSRPKKSRDPDGLGAGAGPRRGGGASPAGRSSTSSRGLTASPIARRCSPPGSGQDGHAPVSGDRHGDPPLDGSRLHPAEGEDGFLMDCAEHLCAVVPAEEIEALRLRTGGKGDGHGDAEVNPTTRSATDSGWGRQGNWRGHFGVVQNWMVGLQDEETEGRSGGGSTAWWRLQHWLDEPTPGAKRDARRRVRPRFAAYRAGLANLHDFVDELVGPRAAGTRDRGRRLSDPVEPRPVAGSSRRSRSS